MLQASASRRALAGFVVSGLLFSFLGAILPAWGYHLRIAEWFAFLDRGLRESVRDETLALLREAGLTVVMVTHDQEEALRVADRIVLMRAGQVEQEGTPAQISRQPVSLYAARFFSQLVELRGHCSGGRVSTPLGEFAAPDCPDGSTICVALRPHDLVPASEGVEARVVESTFLGAARQLRLAVPGLDQPLCLQVSGYADARPGDRLHLRLTGAANLYPEVQESSRSNP